MPLNAIIALDMLSRYRTVEIGITPSTRMETNEIRFVAQHPIEEYNIIHTVFRWRK